MPITPPDRRVALREPERVSRRWPQAPHCRRRFHKAFLAWHAANADRFVIGLEWIARDDWMLTLGFVDISRVLTARVEVPDEITVNVVCEGEHCDSWLWLDARPARVPGGFVCARCPEGVRPIFRSREDLWRNEVFEPFLAWVNGPLASAEAVILSGEPNRWTSARLEPSKVILARP